VRAGLKSLNSEISVLKVWEAGQRYSELRPGRIKELMYTIITIVIIIYLTALVNPYAFLLSEILLSRAS
jgi:hypothetical protein